MLLSPCMSSVFGIMKTLLVTTLSNDGMETGELLQNGSSLYLTIEVLFLDLFFGEYLHETQLSSHSFPILKTPELLIFQLCPSKSMTIG